MILGMDVSRWQGKGNWQVAKAQGIQFAFIRAGSVNATTGKPYWDELLDNHVAGAMGAKIPFGFYWYLRPQYNPNMQANAFLEYTNGLGGVLPMVLDVEEAGGLKPAFLTEAIGRFWNVISDAERVLSLLIYTRQSFFDFNTTKLYPPIPDLWAARWTSGITSPWSDGRYKFRDWITWKFWQFSADGNALATKYGFPGHPLGDNDLDMNFYNGDEAQFAAEFGLEPPAPTTAEILADHERRILLLEAR